MVDCSDSDPSAATVMVELFDSDRVQSTVGVTPTQFDRRRATSPIAASDTRSEVAIMSNPIVSQSPATNNLSVSAADQQPPDVEVGDHNDVALHLGTAGQVLLADVRACKVDVRLAIFNARAARAALLANRPAVETSGVHFNWAHLDTMDSLGRAVTFMVGRVPAREASEVIALLKTGRPLRRLLLSNARTQSLVGRCSAAEVARIQRGSGPLDAANDLVDLAFLHTNNGLVDDLTVTAEKVAQAKAIGTELRDKIRPRGETRSAPLTRAQRDAINVRDRLWTVFVQRYQMMERAAGAVWGADLRQHVPALLARFVPRKKTAPTV